MGLIHSSAVLWFVSLPAFGQVMPGPADADGDGLLDTLDRCPSQPETRNGWQDEDGCPDLAIPLKAVAMDNGRPVHGARLQLVGPGGEILKGIGAVTANVPVGSKWIVTAEAGECMTGWRELVMPDQPAQVNVELANRAPSVVRYAVFDQENRPLSNTVVSMKGTGLCKPAPGPIPPKATHRVGGGHYEVLVSAEGYNWHKEAFDLKPGMDKLVIAKLSPTKVKVVQGRIEILEKVFFDTAKATIKPRSFSLLDEVANTIVARSLKGVEVQGHTDAQGSDAYNQRLSAERAASVVAYLIGAGVEPGQLVAKGYGESRPVSDNGTEEGRELNRRVEFHILGR